MLGAPLESARAMLADVDVQQSAPQHYDLTLRVEGASGRAEREVVLRSCAEVERAVVLLVTTALQMDALDAAELDAALPASEPETTLEPEELEEPEPEPEAAAVPPVPPAPVLPERERPRAKAPPSWWLRLGAAVDLAALPGVTAGPFAGVGLKPRPWSVWVDGRYFLPRERTDPATAQPVELGLYSVALGGAFSFEARRVTFGPAAEVELGLMRARVLGEHADGSARTGWFAALFGLHAEVQVRTGVALALDALLGLPLRRPDFVLADQAPFHRTRALTGRLALGVRVHLGP